MHSTLPIAVIWIIIKDDKILLLKRKNTPWMNWYWWLPWWRLDEWETMTNGTIRELNEEIWIKVKESDIISKSIIQHKDERWERIYFAAHIENYNWKEENIEIDKCEKIEWFELNNLPKNITPQVEICLKAILNKIHFSEFWY
jgi:ADP-ribose pyrophosphatase YjhB (NUDIX family)